MIISTPYGNCSLQCRHLLLFGPAFELVMFDDTRRVVAMHARQWLLAEGWYEGLANGFKQNAQVIELIESIPE